MHFKRHYKNKSEDTLELITATIYYVHMFSVTHKTILELFSWNVSSCKLARIPPPPEIQIRQSPLQQFAIFVPPKEPRCTHRQSRHSLLLLSSTAPPCAKQCPLTYKPRRKGRCHSLTSCLPEQNNEHNWPWQRRFRCRVIGGSHRKDGLDSAFDSNSPWLWRKPVMRRAMREYDPI